MDPRDPVVNVEYEQIEPDFGHQYSDFQEEIDNKLPVPKMKELTATIFIYSDHTHDKVTRRSVMYMICFVGRTPTSYMAKRQSAIQTPTFGAEFVALMKVAEKAATIRYYLS